MADEDDPFAEPDDTDRTVIRPNPGGRRTAATPAAKPASVEGQDPAGFASAPVASADQPVRSADKSITTGLTGMNKLNESAATLFSLVSRIRNRAQHPDPEALRRSVVAEVRAFEARSLQAGVDPQQIKVARYAICATLDDVVLNTPWGGQSQWAQQSMVATFHRETVGGDRFYDLLARLEKDPANSIDLLEFMYMCLSLGFEGRLRVEQGGTDKHMSIRQGLARIIRAQRGDVDRDLSPHWQGVDQPHRVLSAWKPVWIALAAVAAMLTISFVSLSYLLSNRTEHLIGQMSVLEPGGLATLDRRAPPVVVEPTPEQIDQYQRVTAFLKPEIDAGIVEVFQDARTITVRIKGQGMFRSASDALTPEFFSPLSRVAKALNDTKGPVIIAGHSDASPIKSRRFKSNMQLSLARADSVRRKIATEMTDPKRLRAEGRSDKEPIATNETAAGRATNRRIEILLVREGQT